MEDLAGYKGGALRFLRGAGASIGDILEVKTSWGVVTGTLVPRYLYEDGDHVVLKLRSGYNVGLNLAGLQGATVKAKGERPSFSPQAGEGAPQGADTRDGGHHRQQDRLQDRGGPPGRVF
jgi:glutamyl-tRNA(Gln) amidotransferase subunit D